MHIPQHMCEDHWQAPLPAETFSPFAHLINILECLLYIINPVVYTEVYIEGTSNETFGKVWFIRISDSNTVMKAMYLRVCCRVNGVGPPHCPLSEISGVGREAFDRRCPQAGIVPKMRTSAENTTHSTGGPRIGERDSFLINFR